MPARRASVLDRGLFAVVAVCVGTAGAGADGLVCSARDTIVRFETPGSATDIVLEGNLAYVADSYAGLAIVDISEPASPRLVGTCDTPGYANDLSIVGTLAVLADYPTALQVIDVSTPSGPEVIGSFETAYSITDVVASGQMAYFTESTGRLRILDISDPTGPVELGAHDTPGSARRLRVVGEIAYIADGAAGLQVVNISDPRRPYALGAFPAVNEADDVEVAGDLAYLVDAGYGLVVLDVSDPGAPVQVAVAAHVGASGEITIGGRLACVGGGTTLFDISDPTAPVYVGGYPTGGSAGFRGNLAFVAGMDVQVKDMSAPPEPGLLGSSPADDEMMGVDIVWPYAFVADGDAGMHIIDVSDARAPVRIATFETSGWVHDVAVQGNLAYLADMFAGLQIVDVSDPARPALVGSLDSVRSASRLDVGDNIVCLERTAGGLYIVNVAKPFEPFLIEQHHFSGGRGDGGVDIDSGFAFVAHGDFRVFDLSRPFEPPIALVDLDWGATSVRVQGALAYVAGIGRFAIFEVSDPAVPVALGSMPLLNGVSVDGLDIQGHRAFVAMSLHDVWVIDVSDPRSPWLLERSSAWLPPLGSFDVEIEGDTAYVASLANGLQVLDISDCPPCPADFNGDGAADSRDVIGFLNVWVAERGTDCSDGCETDLNGDGTVDTRDFLAFLNLWAAGCP